jgi:hypothetical protein
MIGIPHLLIPHAAIPHGTLPGDFSHYSIYSYDGVIETLIAVAPAGATQINVPHAADETKTYRIRSVSASGVESTDYAELTVERNGDGDVIADRPNAPTATARAVADGYVMVTVVYDPRNAAKAVSTIQIAKRTGGMSGPYDWESPEATITDVSTRKILSYEETVGPYGHNAAVSLAVRAVAADGTPSDIFELPHVVADRLPPDDQNYVEAEEDDL